MSAPPAPAPPSQRRVMSHVEAQTVQFSWNMTFLTPVITLTPTPNPNPNPFCPRPVPFPAPRCVMPHVGTQTSLFRWKVYDQDYDLLGEYFDGSGPP